MRPDATLTHLGCGPELEVGRRPGSPPHARAGRLFAANRHRDQVKRQPSRRLTVHSPMALESRPIEGHPRHCLWRGSHLGSARGATQDLCAHGFSEGSNHVTRPSREVSVHDASSLDDATVGLRSRGAARHCRSPIRVVVRGVPVELLESKPGAVRRRLLPDPGVGEEGPDDGHGLVAPYRDLVYAE